MYRESRDEQGKLTYLSREEGIVLIKDLQVLDLDKNEIVTIKEAYDL